jgi:hypothetical protein
VSAAPAPPTPNGAGLWDIHSGSIHVAENGDKEITTTIRPREPKPPGGWVISWAGWLLVILAGGVLGVSYSGQFVYIFDQRHQIIASNIEAGMFDVGMVILAMLGLGLALARKSARIERAGVMACAFGSATMNYAASDVTSPRSVLAFVAPPLFLAYIVDRVIAAIRRHRLGDDEGSPWAPFGRALLGLARLAGWVLLYSLRFTIDRAGTWAGLKQMVLNAAPLPAAEPAVQLEPPPPPPGPPNETLRAGTKKAALLELYQANPGYGDKSKVARLADELGPLAGLGAGTARTYMYAEIARIEAGK